MKPVVLTDSLASRSLASRTVRAHAGETEARCPLMKGLAASVLLGLLAATNGATAAGDRPPGDGTPQDEHVAIFAGGCFWCVEQAFDEVSGVLRTRSGYTGGHEEDPTYEEVSAGGTGHRESVEVVYDPAVVSYEALLQVFWRNIDPTDAGGQFCDRGSSYTSAIFYRDTEQKTLAEASKREIERTRGLQVITPVLPAGVFYEAEAYHQDYHRKNPVRYRFYKWSCGRAQRLAELW
jgi:peptide-methionine (S)-S-oxide reductase